MKPAPLQLHRATTVAEAVDLLGAFPGEEVKVIAGGQSLVPLLNFRLARPDHLVDLGPVEELRTVEAAGTQLRVGAMVTQRALLEHPLVGERLPVLADALAAIGHGHIRNRGTVGGSLAHADPAAELPAIALALDAEFVVAGPRGRRTVAAADFFDGWFTTAVAEDELLLEVRLPVAEPGAEQGFVELARRQGDFAMVLAVAAIGRDGDDRVIGSRIVLGGVGPTPVRALAAEAALEATVGEEAFRPAAESAAVGIDPADDVHATSAYRSAMAVELVARALDASRRRVAPPTPPPSTAIAGRTRRAVPVEGTEVVVNGTARSLGATPDRRLLADWLRDELGLTGTHLGCEHGVCGACTVLLDGDPVRSCLMLANQAVGREVTTIEQLGTPDSLHPIQEAFRTHHGLQCGFCTPGMVLTTVDLLARIPDPSEARIREELSGNICRCTGYVKIVEAVQAAADLLASRPDPSTPTGKQ